MKLLRYELPRGGDETDWEVELGVVIGRGGKYIHEEDALGHVAGYCAINDLFERACQLEGTRQWVKGKSCEGFGPIGPWLVTPDEVPDPHDLPIWLSVNGHRHPPRFLEAGDIVGLEISGLGRQQQQVIAPSRRYRRDSRVDRLPPTCRKTAFAKA